MRACCILPAVVILAGVGCRRTTVIADEIVRRDAGDSETSVVQDGGDDTETDTGTDTETDTGTDSGGACEVPSSFAWTAGERITAPTEYRSVKDPTAVLDGDEWLMFATAISMNDNFNMIYCQFGDWSEAAAAEKTPANTNENLSGYKAAPQLFFFAPQQLWYLVYQSSAPSYSTSATPRDINSWTAMETFMTLPTNADGSSVGAIDYWIICDDLSCYLFFTAFDGSLYRAKTDKAAFPSGFEGTTQIVLQETDPSLLFDACSVYKMAGTDKYLLLVEALNGPGRYVRSWTADSLEDEWTLWAGAADNAFASFSNVSGVEWAADGIEHGEIPRENPDETMTVDPCYFRYLFSGLLEKEDTASLDYYDIGLLRDARQ